MRFALALHTDDGMAYGVTVPDLPGCFSAGETLDRAIENAYEAIDAHVEHSRQAKNSQRYSFSINHLYFNLLNNS
ncbi:hypothetical protein G3480_20115, partial [Thiorhodococcus mannitoliphagus]